MLGIFSKSFMTATRQQGDAARRWDAPATWKQDHAPYESFDRRRFGSKG